MRRPSAITLVLMGGAILTLGACDSQETRCRRARMEGRPDAEAICAGTSSRSTSSSWFGWSSTSGSSATTSGATSTSSSRGGFGSTASANAGAGG